MTNYPEYVKDKLISIVKEMAASPENFVNNPNRDFTRNRKITFESVMYLLLSMGGNSIYKELLDYFGYETDTATASAFVQQRGKIKPYALEFLFNKFNNCLENYKTYEGYRLFAVDGSDLNIAHNPNDKDTYFQISTSSKGFNLLHLNAMYDLCNKIYVDACIQQGRNENEYNALTDMVERSKINDNVIVIADRGYESYNVFAHIQKKGWQYVIRVKDINSNGIVSSLKLPNKDEFDQVIDLVLTRKQTNEVKAHPELYKIIPKTSTFDYISKDRKSENRFYPISFRVVRFKISDNSYETIITNLSAFEFPPEKLKKLYHMRWGIETSFRELKYAIGLTCFHSKKMDYIVQEVFARLVMYNFCETITSNVIIKQKPTKHGYQVNFTVAIQICKYFFRCFDNINPPNVEAMIQKNILPVREGRKDPRKISTKTSVSFNYRIA